MTLLDEREARAAETAPAPVTRVLRRHGRLRKLLGSEVARFAAGGLLAALLVGAGTFVVVSRDAEVQAVGHARDITEVEARGIVEPALTDSMLRGDAAGLARLDGLVRSRILDESVVRVKLWTTGGAIVYSDQRALVGRHFALDAAELAALRTNTADAGVSNLTDAENVYERGFGKLLQVYLPVRTPGGVELLFETYQRYGAIAQYQSQVWSSFLPVLLAGLGILFLVQVPLAMSMARRLRASLAQREGLLESAINASEQERRRIARDLHDGVVQRLAAVTFSLSALGRRMAAPAAVVPVAAAATVTDASVQTRIAMRELRTLIVEIAPPDLHAEGIDNALRDLLEPLSLAGTSVSVDAPAVTGLPEATTALLFRVAQEAVRNAARHAGATRVTVRLHERGDQVRLEVSDDGRGFSADDLQRRRRDGHVGLSLLQDLVAGAGGSLHVHSRPGAGTDVAVEVPR